MMPSHTAQTIGHLALASAALGHVDDADDPRPGARDDVLSNNEAALCETQEEMTSQITEENESIREYANALAPQEESVMKLSVDVPDDPTPASARPALPAARARARRPPASHLSQGNLTQHTTSRS